MIDVQAAETGSGAWEAALHAFFVESFEPEALRGWVMQHYRPLVAWLPDRPASLHELSGRCIEQARREGYIDAVFFRRLAARFAYRAASIGQIHDAWRRSERSRLRVGVMARCRIPLFISYRICKEPAVSKSEACALVVLDVHNGAEDVVVRDLLVGPKILACDTSAVGGPPASVRVSPTEAKVAQLAPMQRTRLVFELVREGSVPCELNLDFDLGCEQPFDLFVEPWRDRRTSERVECLGPPHQQMDTLG